MTAWKFMFKTAGILANYRDCPGEEQQLFQRRERVEKNRI